MSEEIKKDVQDAELKLDDLDEVAGGAIGQTGNGWDIVTDDTDDAIGYYKTLEEA